METNALDSGAKSWLTVPETAQMLRIPRSRAYALIAEGSLPAVKLGARSLRVNKSELERFLMETRRVGSS
jgi:excisionase family DNA binding protein